MMKMPKTAILFMILTSTQHPVGTGLLAPADRR
jgi:hypothetical protein